MVTGTACSPATRLLHSRPLIDEIRCALVPDPIDDATSWSGTTRPCRRRCTRAHDRIMIERAYRVWVRACVPRRREAKGTAMQGQESSSRGVQRPLPGSRSLRPSSPSPLPRTAHSSMRSFSKNYSSRARESRLAAWRIPRNGKRDCIIISIFFI